MESLGNRNHYIPNDFYSYSDQFSNTLALMFVQAKSSLKFNIQILIKKKKKFWRTFGVIRVKRYIAAGQPVHQCPERTNYFWFSTCMKYICWNILSCIAVSRHFMSCIPFRRVAKMRNAVRDSCVCGVSVQTAQRETQEPSVSTKVTVRRSSAAPSIKVRAFAWYDYVVSLTSWSEPAG